MKIYQLKLAGLVSVLLAAGNSVYPEFNDTKMPDAPNMIFFVMDDLNGWAGPLGYDLDDLSPVVDGDTFHREPQN